MSIRRVGARLGLGRLRRMCASRLVQLSRSIDARRPPKLRVIRYRGTDVVYSRGTSLIERILDAGSYEDDLVAAIVETLSRSSSPHFVDVGANIGLVTVAVLAAVPGVDVVAFEPGAHAASLLRRTIDRNGLDVSLVQAAASDVDGEASFASHDARHASGDGLIDTGRAGAAGTVTVQTVRLDTWWAAAGEPRVDVLKLDVEGAELLTLRGAGDLLARRRPTMFFELHPVNVSVYPYTARDVIQHLNDAGYRTETLRGEGVDVGNVETVIARHTELVGRPTDRNVIA